MGKERGIQEKDREPFLPRKGQLGCRSKGHIPLVGEKRGHLDLKNSILFELRKNFSETLGGILRKLQGCRQESLNPYPGGGKVRGGRERALAFV